MLKIVLTPILRLLFRIRVEGAENVPSEGAVILASNHLSFCDSVFLPLVLHRRATFVAKAEYFDDPRTAWFFRAIGQIPMRREGGSASQRAIDAACDVLREGNLLGIYPEGTRSPDGRLYRGHTGVARLALRCGVPVVAVAMVGTREVQPIGQAMPRMFMPVGVRFSRPLDFSRYAERSEDPAVLRRVTDEIMYELSQLSGQEYVDRYAVRQAELAGSAEPPAAAGDGSRSEPLSRVG